MEFTNEPETTEEIVSSEIDNFDESELEILEEIGSSVESIEENSVSGFENLEENESVVPEVESSSVVDDVGESSSSDMVDDSVVINHWSHGVFFDNNYVMKDHVSGDYFYLDGSLVVYIDSRYNDEIESGSWDFGDITAYYDGFVVYYYYSSPFYIKSDLSIYWIHDLENVDYVDEFEGIEDQEDESMEDLPENPFDEIVAGDMEAVVLAINEQTEVIQKGDAAICAALGLLVGILLIQGFRLRRV